MRQHLIIICCMLAVLFSCTHQRKAEFEAVRTQSQIYYDTGEYQKALDGYRSLAVRFPDDADLADRYIDMAEGIKKQSDRTYGGGKYAAADNIYRILVDYYDDFSRYQRKLSFSKSFLHERIKLSQIKLAEITSMQYLSSGAFQKAINVCTETYRKYRKDNLSQICLVTAASEIGEKATMAYNEGKYAEAGKIYLVLRNNANIFKTAKISATPDIKTIDIKLANCSSYLNKKGFELYRMGALRKALDVWKSILVIDPDNAEVRKAVDTTTEQIENMQ